MGADDEPLPRGRVTREKGPVPRQLLASVTGPLLGEVRVAGFERISHGLYRPVEPGNDDLQFARNLAAWLLLLPPKAVFTHVTAARLRGWTLPALPDHVPVFAAVMGDQTAPRRSGLLCSRLVHHEGTTTIRGFPVEAAEEILLRAARDLGVLDLVIMIDSALSLGDIDVDRMEALLDSHRPGVRVLRSAWRSRDPGAQSSGETLLRVFHQSMEVATDSQVNIVNANGELVGCADLVIRGTMFVQEYDGAHHRTGKQQRVDLRRERSLSGTAAVRRGYTLDDLLNHAAAMMHELDRMLDRPHDLRRLTRWKRLVADSLYSESGQRRVRNRWRRHTSACQWTMPA